MRYVSTRGEAAPVGAAEAIVCGLAPDGGLYVPETIPAFTPGEIRLLREGSYAEAALCVCRKYLSEIPEAALGECVRDAYARFDGPDPAPLAHLSGDVSVLELWHGPTCAFKDMALQLFPRILPLCKEQCGETSETWILVATSGDTGKAALEGFRDVEGVRVFVFYPRDGVSEVQKAQMTTQRGGNVFVAAIDGNFDDAQTAVKRALSDEALARRLRERGARLSSANSINFGRLLPQIVYYARTALRLSDGGAPVHFVVPSGNFGNILAGWFAKAMGAPVGRLVCASNENRVLTDFLATGDYDARRPFHKTSSPSMDILVSSNLERMLYLACGRDAERVRGWMRALREEGHYSVDAATLARIRETFRAGSCDGEGTLRAIADCWREHGYLLDPHTAVGYDVLRRADLPGRTVLVSTASPFKFAQDVLAAIGRPGARGFAAVEALAEATGMAVPASLAELPSLPVRFTGVLAPDAIGDVL